MVLTSQVQAFQTRNYKNQNSKSQNDPDNYLYAFLMIIMLTYLAMQSNLTHVFHRISPPGGAQKTRR